MLYRMKVHIANKHMWRIVLIWPWRKYAN